MGWGKWFAEEIVDRRVPVCPPVRRSPPAAVVESVEPGTQAAADHPHIVPGMQLVSVGGTEVVGTGYSIILMVRRQARTTLSSLPVSVVGALGASLSRLLSIIGLL